MHAALEGRRPSEIPGCNLQLCRGPTVVPKFRPKSHRVPPEGHPRAPQASKGSRRAGQIFGGPP
eukprot:10969963-Alexandrium_andersonii.AAC.1